MGYNGEENASSLHVFVFIYLYYTLKLLSVSLGVF